MNLDSVDTHLTRLARTLWNSVLDTASIVELCRGLSEGTPHQGNKDQLRIFENRIVQHSEELSESINSIIEDLGLLIKEMK